MSAVALAAPTFSERVHQLLERVDYRRADSPSEREAIYRLRYDAYVREGALKPDFQRKLSDRYDELDNTWTYGIYIEGQLASSVRLHLSTKGRSDFPGADVFADALQPALDAGRTIVDPTRFVADATCARAYPELPYVTLRLGFLAADYFAADLVLATVRTEHQAFYKRVFGHKPICPPRNYLTLTKPLTLMVLDFPPAREQILARYPFFRSSVFERRMLFERPLVATQRSAAA